MTFNNKEIFSSDAYGGKALFELAQAQRYYYWLASLIKPYLGSHNLEIGAGNGNLAKIMAQNHCVDLLEICDEFTNDLSIIKKEQSNIGFLYNSLNQINIQYDCIYSANVLEHVEDDFNFIKELSLKIKPNGFLVSFVPASKILYSQFDHSIGHYRRYNKNDVTRLNELIKQDQLPLKLVSYRLHNPIGFFAWLVKMRICKAKEITQKDIRINELLMPIIALIDKIPLGVGQSMLFIFQKVENKYE
jgi:SAM-dependent methyltransferase